MTLTTHSLVGAAVAQLFPNRPWLGFLAGFISHFALDSVPHWDYRLISYKRDPANQLNDDMAINKKFLVDLAKIGLDCLLGLGLAILIFHFWRQIPFWTPVLGAIGGILPDPLQFLYWKIRREPLITLQKFHIWIQRENAWNASWILGAAVQLIFFLIIFIFTSLI